MLFQLSRSKSQIGKVRETPQPGPLPPQGVREDARLSMGYGGRGRFGARRREHLRAPHQSGRL
jgi:hypothetical protein